MDSPKYKRVLLKLSGEMLSAGNDGILDFEFIEKEKYHNMTGIAIFPTGFVHCFA